MVFPRILSFTLLMVGGCMSALAAETFQVSWDPMEFNPMARLHPEQRIALTPRPEGVGVVDQSSEPTSPFGEQSALFINSSQNNKFWFRFYFRALEGTEFSETSKGTTEFLLQPEQGAINIQVGFQRDPWIPETIETYYVDSGLFNLSLSPGQEPKLAGRVMETDSVLFIEPSQNYRVTMKWDLEDDEPVIRIFLNGEPLRERGSPDPFNAAILNLTTGEGLNVFRITLGNSEHQLGSFFLGPMAAASGEDPDLENAEKPLTNP
jgi:hypothetical protein